MIDWKRMRGVPLVDIYGFGERARFDKAFVECLKDNQYPAPTAINRRRLDWRGNPVKVSNRINGRLSYRRLQLMFLFGIAYKNPQIIDDYGGFGLKYQTPIKEKDLGIPKEYYGCLKVTTHGNIAERKG